MGGKEREERGMVAWFLSRVTEWKVVSLDSLRNIGGNIEKRTGPPTKNQRQEK